MVAIYQPLNGSGEDDLFRQLKELRYVDRTYTGVRAYRDMYTR